MKKLLCNFCKKECVEIVSLRHFFYKCDNCKNIKRSFTKKINLFDFFLWTPLYRLSNYSKTKKNQFDYYLNVKKNYDYKGDKFYLIQNFIKKKNIKSVLEISAGSGLVGYHLKKRLKINYDMTEFNQKLVDNMKKFKMNSYILDLDNIDKNKVPKKKYDLIILYYSIYYCKNLKKLILFLKNKLKKNSYIMINQNIPNFACATKFSIMENYPPYIFYDSNYLIKKFKEYGVNVDTYQEQYIGNFIVHYFFKFSNMKSFIYHLIQLLLSLYYILRNFTKIRCKDLILRDYMIIFKS